MGLLSQRVPVTAIIKTKKQKESNKKLMRLLSQRVPVKYKYLNK